MKIGVWLKIQQLMRKTHMYARPRYKPTCYNVTKMIGQFLISPLLEI
jgi:hypothetical protein